ncbi:MAG: hypothetical protein OXH99_01230 [Bryobacterales bacterium]|nr:hypothetical protein [Bryobacterales bacterium]
MDCPVAWVNSIGLGLDIAGVVLLFFFGLPAEVSRSGALYLSWGANEEEARKGRRYERISRFALVLLVVGFALQIASNWMPWATLERSEAAHEAGEVREGGNAGAAISADTARRREPALEEAVH